MKKLTSTQAKYLRGIAHGLKPVVFIGQKGLTDALIHSTEEAFDSHELIKIKFIDYKEKKQKKEIARNDRSYRNPLQAAPRSGKA
jgi:RNA-binding protein